MDEFLDIPTLIVIGVAIVVLVRLRGVLGTRTGNERSPLQSAERPKPANDEKVVPLRPAPTTTDTNAEKQALKLGAECEQLAGGRHEVAQGLRAIVEADPDFSPKNFIEGAKMAYEMIVTAFAMGDRKALKGLLEKDVYDGFEREIAEREGDGRSVDFTFVGLPKVEIVEAGLDKRDARITVQFDAEVVSATLAGDGTLIEGNADQVQTLADRWTFARSPKSRDPNWKLVATNPIA